MVSFAIQMPFKIRRTPLTLHLFLGGRQLDVSHVCFTCIDNLLIKVLNSGRPGNTR